MCFDTHETPQTPREFEFFYALTAIAPKSMLSSGLVPERVFISGGGDGASLTRSASEGGSSNGNDEGTNGHANGHFTAPATSGLVGLLLQSLLSERTVFQDDASPELTSLKELANRMAEQAMQNMQMPPADPKVVDAKSIAALAK
jgi:hypothetical protein